MVSLFDVNVRSQNGVPPYLFENNGYPSLPWFTTPHKERMKMSSNFGAIMQLQVKEQKVNC
jgi:hypothetical protein